MNSFQEGQDVYAICLPDGTRITRGGGADRISVVMEYSHIGLVPWFVTFKEGKLIEKYNGAYVASVVL